MAAVCGVGAAVFAIPARLTGYEEIERPVEVVCFEELIGHDRVRLASERETIDSLRSFFGLPPGRLWLDDRYPLVHGPDPALPAPPPMADPPEVIVLVIESLRASCLPAFNRRVETDGCETPHLARLAEESVVLPCWLSNRLPSGEGFITMTASLWPHQRRRITSVYERVQFDALPLRLSEAGFFAFGAEPSADFDHGGPWLDRFLDQRIHLQHTSIGESEKNLFEVVRHRIEEHAGHIDFDTTLLALIGAQRPTAAIGRDLPGTARSSEATVVVVRPGGFWIDRKRPTDPVYSGAFPGMAADGSAKIFGPEDARMLSEHVFAFSFLIENHRISRPDFLAARNSALALHRAPSSEDHPGRQVAHARRRRLRIREAPRCFAPGGASR